MADLKKVKQMVANELTKRPETRDDDFILITYIYKDFFGIREFTFESVMFNHIALGLPSFESIRRCRQKLQEEMPLIYGSSGAARKIRAKEETVYRREFAR